jgi:hypothetical protein
MEGRVAGCETATISLVRSRCTYREQRIAIDEMHPAGLHFPIIATVLKDAKSVDPQVAAA